MVVPDSDAMSRNLGVTIERVYRIKVIVENGGTLFAQDEESSVVWGMPGSVATAGLSSVVASYR